MADNSKEFITKLPLLASLDQKLDSSSQESPGMTMREPDGSPDNKDKNIQERLESL